jgi:hypothetical protein
MMAGLRARSLESVMEFNRKYKGSVPFLNRSAQVPPLPPGADAAPAPEGDGFSTLDVLGMIERIGKPSEQELGEALGTDAEGLAAAIRQAVGEGFIAQSGNAWVLTDQGERALRYSRIAKI